MNLDDDSNIQEQYDEYSAYVGELCAEVQASHDSLYQHWFNILLMMGNPVEDARSEAIKTVERVFKLQALTYRPTVIPDGIDDLF